MLIDNYNKFINDKLKEISNKNQLRELKTSARLKHSYIIKDNKKFLSFACNDYLSLSTDKRLLQEASKATFLYGIGSGASRLITGNNPLYKKLEKKISLLKKAQASIVFGSGFLANLGVISSLSKKNDMILIDNLSHSSSYLGTRLTESKVIKFNHNCMDDLEKKLYKYRKKFNNCFILTEGVFSMDGDISPQDKITHLKKKYNAIFVLDDAHGLGVVGDGSGSTSLFNKVEVDICIGTLSKSIGSYGGFVSGKKTLIDFLINRCRTQIYTTGLPPAVLAASTKAIDIIENSPNLIRKPLENAKFFSKLLNLKTPHSPIVPIILKKEQKVIEACKLLEKNGYLVGGIRPPTVPVNTSRLRLAFNSSHTKKNITAISEIIKKFF